MSSWTSVSDQVATKLSFESILDDSSTHQPFLKRHRQCERKTNLSCWPSTALQSWTFCCMAAATQREGKESEIKSAPHWRSSAAPFFPWRAFRCLNRVQRVVFVHSHPNFYLFKLLPCARPFRSKKTTSNGLKNCFYPIKEHIGFFNSIVLSCTAFINKH